MTVNFEVLKSLLIRFVKLRVRNGDCTERQLARLVGVSQSQLHNVLKGVRPLKQGLADALLKHFQIGLLDLLREGESGANESRLYGEATHDFFKTAERLRLTVFAPAPNSKKAAASERRIPGQSSRRAG